MNPNEIAEILSSNENVMAKMKKLTELYIQNRVEFLNYDSTDLKTFIVKNTCFFSYYLMENSDTEFLTCFLKEYQKALFEPFNDNQSDKSQLTSQAEKLIIYICHLTRGNEAKYLPFFRAMMDIEQYLSTAVAINTKNNDGSLFNFVTDVLTRIPEGDKLKFDNAHEEALHHTNEINILRNFIIKNKNKFGTKEVQSEFFEFLADKNYTPLFTVVNNLISFSEYNLPHDLFFTHLLDFTKNIFNSCDIKLLVELHQLFIKQKIHNELRYIIDLFFLDTKLSGNDSKQSVRDNTNKSVYIDLEHIRSLINHYPGRKTIIYKLTNTNDGHFTREISSSHASEIISRVNNNKEGLKKGFFKELSSNQQFLREVYDFLTKNPATSAANLDALLFTGHSRPHLYLVINYVMQCNLSDIFAIGTFFDEKNMPKLKKAILRLFLYQYTPSTFDNQYFHKEITADVEKDFNCLEFSTIRSLIEDYADLASTILNLTFSKWEKITYQDLFLLIQKNYLEEKYTVLKNELYILGYTIHGKKFIDFCFNQENFSSEASEILSTIVLKQIISQAKLSPGKPPILPAEFNDFDSFLSTYFLDLNSVPSILKNAFFAAPYTWVNYAPYFTLQLILDNVKLIKKTWPVSVQLLWINQLMKNIISISNDAIISEDIVIQINTIIESFSSQNSLFFHQNVLFNIQRQEISALEMLSITKEFMELPLTNVGRHNLEAKLNHCTPSEKFRLLRELLHCLKNNNSKVHSSWREYCYSAYKKLLQEIPTFRDKEQEKIYQELFRIQAINPDFLNELAIIPKNEIFYNNVNKLCSTLIQGYINWEGVKENQSFSELAEIIKQIKKSQVSSSAVPKQIEFMINVTNSDSLRNEWMRICTLVSEHTSLVNRVKVASSWDSDLCLYIYKQSSTLVTNYAKQQLILDLKDDLKQLKNSLYYACLPEHIDKRKLITDEIIQKQSVIKEVSYNIQFLELSSSSGNRNQLINKLESPLQTQLDTFYKTLTDAYKVKLENLILKALSIMLPNDVTTKRKESATKIMESIVSNSLSETLELESLTPLAANGSASIFDITFNLRGIDYTLSFYHYLQKMKKAYIEANPSSLENGKSAEEKLVVNRNARIAFFKRRGVDRDTAGHLKRPQDRLG